MVTINDFLSSVLSDFKTYVNSKEKLCVLRDTHYDAGRIPDYTNPHIQQLYLLRYAYAYAFEYKMMYRNLLSRIDFGQKIQVTSIGCGNLIDYWSLSRVVGDDCSICYRGIDAVDWGYKFDGRYCDDVMCKIGNVVDVFQSTSCFVSDVYIFPKSISEFSDEEIRSLINSFTSDNILKDTVSFLFSLRTDSGSIQRDGAKTSIIYNHMLQCGFHTQDRCDEYYHFDDSIRGKKIREVDEEFLHPNDVIDFLKYLYINCDDFQICEKKEDCMGRLGRWPILSCKQVSWQLFTFER